MTYKNSDTAQEYEKFYLYSYNIVGYNYIFKRGESEDLFNYTHNVLAEFGHFFIHKHSKFPFKSLYDEVSNEEYIKNKELTFLTNKEQLLSVLKRLEDLSLGISSSPEPDNKRLVIDRIFKIKNKTSDCHIQFLRLIEKNTLGFYKFSMIIMDLFKIFKEFVTADLLDNMRTHFCLFPFDLAEFSVKHEFTIVKYMTFFIIDDVPLTDIKIHFYNDDKECDLAIGYKILRNYIMFEYNELEPYLGYRLKIKLGNEYESRSIKLL